MSLPVIMAITLGAVLLFILLGVYLKDWRLSYAFSILTALCFTLFEVLFIIFHPLVGIISVVFALLLVGIILTDTKFIQIRAGVMQVLVYLIGMIWATLVLYQLVELALGRPLF